MSIALEASLSFNELIIIIRCNDCKASGKKLNATSFTSTTKTKFFNKSLCLKCNSKGRNKKIYGNFSSNKPLKWLNCCKSQIENGEINLFIRPFYVSSRNQKTYECNQKSQLENLQASLSLWGSNKISTFLKDFDQKTFFFCLLSIATWSSNLIMKCWHIDHVICNDNWSLTYPLKWSFDYNLKWFFRFDASVLIWHVNRGIIINNLQN